ncbi:MAG: alpha/beta hydrolase [Gammaproteobacteria bacterium]|jgi:pimeloyl-ACP methyl ester carboxylesterase|nr:hypothetical protein [Gammaproteobacteria bacterium]MBQ09718.1 hypothetical protein [Gammaproteobacteria bacterium]MDP6147069.1 alpha/beta hydrolase [Gammaproteobacteria bacterium]HJL79577.1 alpha/beta hydrolase [Gammaproteobacteria bacterium]HJM09716.1 alpha/beta hydrolase [Gammaproteobacteria bacterium]|tara:strand:- start:9438 stop:10367 length:930 start_codon:yes stop_codon:yes gene_type:complete
MAIVALTLLTMIALDIRYPSELSKEAIESKYLLEFSEFKNIDGVNIHFTDEGEGPALLLLHANYANLIDWEPWVRQLKKHFRVIRIDIPGHGLTEADPKNDYSMERTVFLIQELLDELKVQKLSIAGASLGGTIGLHFTRHNPEKIENLILVSPGALNPRVRGRTKPVKLPKPFELVAYITPKTITEALLKGGFGDPNNITEELVTRWHDLLIRKGQRDAQIARVNQYVSGDIDQVLNDIKSPALIMWGEKNSVVPVALAFEMKKMMSNSSNIEMIIYETGGHQLVQELGLQTGKDALKYLMNFYGEKE